MNIMFITQTREAMPDGVSRCGSFQRRDDGDGRDGLFGSEVGVKIIVTIDTTVTGAEEKSMGHTCGWRLSSDNTNRTH